MGIPDRGGYAGGAGIREGEGIPEIPEGVGIPEGAGTLGDRYMRGEGGYTRGGISIQEWGQYTRGGQVHQKGWAVVKRALCILLEYFLVKHANQMV